MIWQNGRPHFANGPRLLGLILVILGATFSGASQNNQPAAPIEIAFTVSIPKPHTHLLHVEMNIKHVADEPVANEVVLVLPVWTPGSYLIREFERQIQDFAATDAAGQPLAWIKSNKNSWRIVTSGAREWHVSYLVYCNELSVRTSEVNSDHAFWNNASLLMYPEGFLNARSTLHVLAPQPWQVATGLPPAPGAKNTFRAENFDVLYDSPVEASNFKTISFEVKGVPHRIVIDGEGNYKLMTTPKLEGASPGWYIVTIIAQQPYDESKSSWDPPWLINRKYGSRQSSGLAVEVVEKAEAGRYDFQVTK